jgi:methylated-DNA-[protein]-cysteine S-methyltransferase
VVVKNIYTIYLQSPLGRIRIQGDGRRLVSLDFFQKKGSAKPHSSLRQAAQQLAQYFKGKRRRFSLKLDPSGTVFQRTVWQSLKKIKFGQTSSYQAVALASGRKRAVRAAASAVGKNRFAIVVPCHRVIATNGTLAGYAGGVWRKRWLLDHESKWARKK